MEDAEQPLDKDLLAPPVQESEGRDVSSSPDLPLAKGSHSRQNSLVTPPAVGEETTTPEVEDTVKSPELPEPVEVHVIADAHEVPSDGQVQETNEKVEDGDEDLLGSLEKSIGSAEQAA